MIKLPEETYTRAVESIRAFCEEALDEPIGDLKARMLLDYFLAEIAPSVYNGAVADAQRFFQEKVHDLDGSCHEIEFNYQPDYPGRRTRGRPR